MVDLERLRELSGITLSLEGVFLHHGAVIENPKIQELFSQGIALNAQGRATLTVGPQWCYIEPEDTLYVVRGMAMDKGQGPRIRLNDGTREVLQTDTVFLTESGALYCNVKEGRGLARFSRNAYHQISVFFEEVPGQSGIGLAVQGSSFPVPVRERDGRLVGARKP